MLGCPAPIRENVIPATFTGTFRGGHSPARSSKGRTETVLSQTALKTWLGRAAWVMKSSCQGNPPAPTPGTEVTAAEGSHLSVPPIWQGDTKHLLLQTPIPEHPGEVFPITRHF